MSETDFTPASIPSVDVKKLALNKDFGKLDFKNALEHIEKLQNLFVELDELGYQQQLTVDEVSSIDNQKNHFVTLLNRLKNFDIGQTNSQQLHDQIEQEFVNQRNTAEKAFRAMLTYLRQQAATDSQDAEELRRMQKEAAQTKQQYEKLSEQLSEQLKKLADQQTAIASKKGEVAAETFGKHFEASATEFSDAAEQRWFVIGRTSFILLIVIVAVNIIGYLTIFVGEKLGWWTMVPTDFFTLEYTALKLALLLLLSYLVGFASRQYGINSHLAVTNLHRKNVAETMKDFYESDLDAAAKAVIIDRATEAMFKNLPVGYITKSESKDNDGPVHQVINQIPKINGKSE